MVCATKDEGGLGVLNLGNHNEVLLMKYLHKFYNREDIPWVSLVWEKYYSNGRLPENSNRGSFWWFIHKYKDVARIDLKDGRTCLLWSDMWLGMAPETSFPELYSFAKNKRITVAMAMLVDGPQDLFHLPLSEEAYAQFIQLQTILQSLQLTDDKDSWGFIWGSNLFSSTRVYKQLSGHNLVHPALKWLWHCSCQNKHRIFFWLILNNKLNTRGGF